MSIHKILSWTAVILWMAFIFTLSSQVAQESNQLSTGITEVVVKTVKKVAPKAEFDMETFNHIVRKNAHFFAYLVLGILVTNALNQSSVVGVRCVIMALLICVLFAISDEVHQFFVPGRGPGVKDVFIDSAGAGFGIGVYLIVSKSFKKTKNEKMTAMYE